MFNDMCRYDYIQYNIGQLGRSGLDLNVEPVWKQGITGTGVTVAVVDDGERFSSTTTDINCQNILKHTVMHSVVNSITKS